MRMFFKESMKSDLVREIVNQYVDLHRSADEDQRRGAYKDMVNGYYDLVTDFYEYGWGDSFHFAPRYHQESFASSLARHQHFIALKLGLRAGHTVLDAGCGVGGPARSIARFSGANIVGLNNNAYQVERARTLTEKAGLSHLCRYRVGDFMNIDVPDAHFDGAFAIESTAHAPNKTRCFAEILRTLAPGADFVGYEWCLTARHDSGSLAHRQITSGIEKGCGLSDIATISEVEHALTDAGFEVLCIEDRAASSDAATPWYLPLQGRGIGPREVLMKPIGRRITDRVVGALETLGVLPEGAREVTKLLNDGAHWLVRGGEEGVFTPMLFFHARRPV